MASLGPEERADLSRWLDEQRKLIKRGRRAGKDPELMEQLVEKFIGRSEELQNRTYHEEALEVALEGLSCVKRPEAHQLLGHKVWQAKAVHSLFVGRGRRVLLPAASPGILPQRITIGPARPERRSQPELTDFAWQRSPNHFHHQWYEEACCDPP